MADEVADMVVDIEVDKVADIAVDNWTWRLTRLPAWWWTVDTLSTTPLGVFLLLYLYLCIHRANTLSTD